MALESILNTHESHVVEQTLIIEQSFWKPSQQRAELKVKGILVTPCCSVTDQLPQNQVWPKTNCCAGESWPGSGWGAPFQCSVRAPCASPEKGFWWSHKCSLWCSGREEGSSDH